MRAPRAAKAKSPSPLGWRFHRIDAVRWTFVFGALGLAALVGCAAVPNGPDSGVAGESVPGGAGQSGPDAPATRRPARGSISTRAILRAAGSDSDVDLSAYVEAELGEPDGPGNGALQRSGDAGGPGAASEGDRWSARFAGRVHADLDGSDGDVFGDLDQAGRSSVVPRIYDAYGDYAPAGDTVAYLRLGRQSDAETPVFVVYDGLRVESEPHGDAAVVFGLYGGASTHQYESSSDGDTLLGVYGHGRPWSGARLRLDWVHAEDERTLGSFDEDLVGVSLRQRFSRTWRGSAAWTALGGDSRDVDLDATWASTDGRRLVRATYYELFETQSFNPLEFDSYSETLFDWFPFRRGGLLGWTRLGEAWRLEAGIERREVDDDEDEGRFNRDVQRAHLTASWEGALGRGTTLSLTGDQWRSDASDVESLGATIAKAIGAKDEVSLGTYYAAYEFDPLLLTEREDVRTYFASFRRKASESVTLDTSYAFQDTEFEEFHTLKVTLRWQF